MLCAAFQPIAKKLLETALPENVYKTLIIDSKDLAMKTQEEADAFLSALRDCGLSQHEIAVFALIASIGTGYENLQRMIGVRQAANGKAELFFREAILPAESDDEEETTVSRPLMNSLIDRIDSTDEPVSDPSAKDESQPLTCLMPDIAFEEGREYLRGIEGTPEEKRNTLEVLSWALHFIEESNLRRVGENLRKTLSEAHKVPLETIDIPDDWWRNPLILDGLCLSMERIRRETPNLISDLICDSEKDVVSIPQEILQSFIEGRGDEILESLRRTLCDIGAQGRGLGNLILKFFRSCYLISLTRILSVRRSEGCYTVGVRSEPITIMSSRPDEAAMPGTSDDTEAQSVEADGFDTVAETTDGVYDTETVQ